MDTTQTILLAVVVVLAIFLAALGFQAFFALKDLRRTLWRTNRLLDDADQLVSEVKKPLESAGHFVTALTAGAGIAHILKKASQLASKKLEDGKK